MSNENLMARMIETVSRYTTAVGNCPAGEVAQEWIDAGFDEVEADRWISVGGCWDAEAAAKLRDLGVTPEQASAEYRDGISYGYSVANNDISARDAARAVAE